MAAHFYVTLPSNSSFQYFPDNTLSSFTTQLAEPILLTGSWEVALCEIQYPFNWHNVTASNCRIRLNDREICIPHGYYDTMQDVIDKFHELLTEDERNNVKIYQQKHNLRTTYKLKTGTTLALQGMSRMFGFLENNKVCTEGFTVSDISSDVHSGLTSFFFFVYSDIVEHQRVGDTHVPLLRVVRIGTRKAGEHVTVSYNSPHYVPVKSKHISTIGIDLRTDLGDVVPFQHGRVIAKLHFRQSRSPFFV
ncbi:hypothetical protein HOLleu_12105 [Holothuria leucospilota]|uniref:Uncharacterized protein n=1 Tax=Holothuria leucospilota TaxID=206669 RepID=A0A9Q1CAS1_HOLLE|nr:hypothetical protein HOLleu_12105 [Holothuria leucospilota]